MDIDRIMFENYLEQIFLEDEMLLEESNTNDTKYIYEQKKKRKELLKQIGLSITLSAALLVAINKLYKWAKNRQENTDRIIYLRNNISEINSNLKVIKETVNVKFNDNTELSDKEKLMSYEMTVRNINFQMDEVEKEIEKLYKKNNLSLGNSISKIIARKD